MRIFPHDQTDNNICISYKRKKVNLPHTWVCQVSSFPFQLAGSCSLILLQVSHNSIYHFFNYSGCFKSHLGQVIPSLLSFPLLVSRISWLLYILNWLGCSCYTKRVAMKPVLSFPVTCSCFIYIYQINQNQSQQTKL